MEKATIIDGGFSTELDALGFNVDADPLWGAGALKTNPEAVIQVHKNYVLAGCDVITSSSYQASVDGFVRHLGVSNEEALNLIGNSVRLAQEAIRDQKRRVLIAGSVGPYGATLHDGSEYNGNYVDQSQWKTQELGEWHRGRVESLLEAGADLLALETQPALTEVLALLNLLREKPNARAWLSFSCSSDGRHTAHGELFKEAIKSCLQHSASGQLVAIGVNCCSPEIVSSLLDQAAKGHQELGLPSLPFIAYPNSGEKFLPGVGWESEVEGATLCSYSVKWFNAGATWLGGCCRTGPKNILQIRQILSAHLYPDSVNI